MGVTILDGPRLLPASGGQARSLIVLLHGYGSNGADLIALAPLVQPLLPDALFVAPNAPSRIPNLAEAYQWWPIRTFSMEERLAGVAAAAPAIDAFLTAELVRLNLNSDRLLLIGFSQGTMMALHVGLRRKAAVAGIIGYSGMLVGADRLAAEIRSRPPILLVHGTADDVVPFDSLAEAERGLKSVGLNVKIQVSPGIGHSVGPDGLAAGAAFARGVLVETQGGEAIPNMTAKGRSPSVQYPVTPDGRYCVVRGRLWRVSDPNLPSPERDRLVSELMAARREVRSGLRSGDGIAVSKARAKVDMVKRSLGERGPPWWQDGAPDLNRHLVHNTIYGDWFAKPGTR